MNQPRKRVHLPTGHTAVLFSAFSFIYFFISSFFYYYYYSTLALHRTLSITSRAAGSYNMNGDYHYSDDVLCGFFIILLPLKPLSSNSLKCNGSLMLMEQSGPLPGFPSAFLLWLHSGRWSAACFDGTSRHFRPFSFSYWNSGKCFRETIIQLPPR